MPMRRRWTPDREPTASAWTAPVRAVRRLRSSNRATPDQPRHSDHNSAIVDCGLYIEGVRQEGEWGYADALATARRHRNAFVWLGLREPTEQEMTGIARTYGLHELPVEDAIRGGQRPKLEQFGDVAFLVLRTTRYLSHDGLTETSQIIETGHIMLFIGEHFVITVRHGDAAELSPVRADLEKKRDLLRNGPWAVAYAVTDRVVDLYIDVAFAIEQDLDELEENVFSRHGAPERIQSIYQLKRELVEFKRAVVPLHRPLMALVSEKSAVPKEMHGYFGDVQDHLTRTVEQVNSFDEVLNSILQARLAQLTVDQNNDLRKIAAWAAIAAVETFIAGVYGMNFRFMPETEWRYGYPAVLAVMLVSAFALYRFFRRSGWL
ncbi:MAG: magnesium/cobalt transporter CorA [Micromonosporaceae bacterium]